MGERIENVIEFCDLYLVPWWSGMRPAKDFGIGTIEVVACRPSDEHKFAYILGRIRYSRHSGECHFYDWKSLKREGVYDRLMTVSIYATLGFFCYCLLNWWSRSDSCVPYIDPEVIDLCNGGLFTSHSFAVALLGAFGCLAVTALIGMIHSKDERAAPFGKVLVPQALIAVTAANFRRRAQFIKELQDYSANIRPESANNKAKGILLEAFAKITLGSIFPKGIAEAFGKSIGKVYEEEHSFARSSAKTAFYAYCVDSICEVHARYAQRQPVRLAPRHVIGNDRVMFETLRDLSAGAATRMDENPIAKPPA